MQYALEIPLGSGEWVDGIFGGTTKEERTLMRVLLGLKSFDVAKAEAISSSTHECGVSLVLSIGVPSTPPAIDIQLRIDMPKSA